MSYSISRFDSELVAMMGARVLKRKKGPPAPATTPASGQRYIAPGQDSDLHFGFVNCANNPGGMQAEFFAEKDGRVTCLWNRTERTFEGYPGLIHGGVLTALLDELMANALVSRLGRFGVTVKGEFQWRRAIKVGEEVRGHGFVAARMGRLVKCKGRLVNKDAKVCATSAAIFYLPTLETFKKLTRVDSVPDEIHRYFAS